MSLAIHYNPEQLADFCRRWMIREMLLFGSALRDDFRADSDVDVMVTFDQQAPWSLWDWPTMTDELQGIFGRSVDLVEKSSITNPFRRKHIWENHEVLYAA